MKIVRAAADGLKGTVCPLIIASAFLSIAGCGGNGKGLDASGRPLGEDTVDIALSPTYQSIQVNIFTPICSVCHIGGGAPEGLRLDAANAYTLLVGVPSTEVPSVMRVKPGDPDNSYIIQKLEGHAAVGARMPFGGPYLSANTIGFIRQWIMNGASQTATVAVPATEAVPATGAAAATDKFTVLGVVPDSSEPVSESPPQISVAFNHDLDVTQLDPRAARIEKLDAATGNVTEVIPARTTVPGANLKALMIWPSRQLGVGHYQAVIRTAQPEGFADVGGQVSAFGARNANGEFIVSTFDVEVLP